MNSDDKDLPALPNGALPTDVTSRLNQWREALQRLIGTRGDPKREAVRWGDLIDGGLADARRNISAPTGGAGGVGPAGPPGPPGPPGESGVVTPDLTKPPTPTGLGATAGFGQVIVQWNAPTYTAGHGHKQTNIYATKQPAADSTPYTINDAVRVDSAQGALMIRAIASDLGIKWRFWIKWESSDGVESDPAGGVNGVVVTTGKIGTADLGALIVEAGNLADGAITTEKFSTGIEPVTLYTSGSLPTAKSTSTIFYSGKLYRWNGTAYVATVPTSDLSGTVSDAQIAGLAASKVTGTLTDAQLAAISAAKITGQITGTQITDGAVTTAKIFAGSITTSKIAADAVTSNEIAAGAVTASELAAGAVTTAKLAAGAVTANEIAAGAVTAGKVAANAITANELAADSVTAGKIAAGSITTSKLLVSGAGASLNADPWCMDSSAWSGPPQMLSGVSDAPFGSTAIANAVGGNASPSSIEYIPVESNKRYRIEGWIKQLAGTGGYLYLGVIWYGAAKNVLISSVSQPTGAGSPAGWANGSYSYFVATNAVPTSWTRYVTTFGPGEACAIPSNAKFMRVVALLNNDSVSGVQQAVTGFKLMEKADADLIVDGAITASKIAANAIAVGTAAIQNGAIVNAMLANATIDDAKVANLSAAKLTAGDGTIGGNLKSSNYSNPSATGWIIRPDGYAEFNNVVIRGATYTGTIYANAGTIGGITIASGYLRAGQLGFDNGNGFYLGSDGRFSLGNSAGNKITWDGSTLNVVGGGAFSGSLTAATVDTGGLTVNSTGHIKGGQTGYDTGNGFWLGYSGSAYKFSLKSPTGQGLTFDGTNLAITGSLTAQAVNAVQTVNIAGNAVTIPVAATWDGSLYLYSGQIVATASADFGGQPVLITAQVTVSAPEYQCGLRVQLYRNGTVISTSGSFEARSGPETPLEITGTLVFIDNPGTGTFAYGVGGVGSTMGLGYQYTKRAVITAVGVKR